MLARIGIVPDESDVIGRMYPSYISLASLLSVSCPSVFFVGSGLPLEPVLGSGSGYPVSQSGSQNGISKKRGHFQICPLSRVGGELITKVL